MFYEEDLSIACLFSVLTVHAQQLHPEAVNFSQVKLTDSFWRPKIDKVSTVTLDAYMDQTEVKTPRIRNFEKVARHRFFYGNALAWTGNIARREWFGTACCPANIARLVASLGNYVCAYIECRLDKSFCRQLYQNSAG